MTLYTDIDASCCEVLSARVADGGLGAGEVWRRDVRTLTADELAPFAQVHLFCGMGGSPLGLRWGGWPPDLPIVTGGFPCQDVSSAGKGAGLDGARSGLYREALRVIEIKHPVGAILENVGALSARGLDRVAGALESLGYEVEALRMGSWAVGAPDKRERWWFVCRRIGWTGGVGDIKVVGVGRLPAGQRRPEAAAHDAVRAGEAGHVADLNGAEPRIASSGGGHGAAGVAAEPGEGGQLADLAGGGQEAERIVGAGPVADQPGTRGRLADQSGAGLGAGRGVEEHEERAGSGRDQPDSGGERGRLVYAQRAGRADAGTQEVTEQRDAGEPGRWPHPRWFVVETIEGRQVERTIPTPQYEWEPPRLFPGTRTVNARWRLALMGYPLHWLDVDAEKICEASGNKSHRHNHAKRDRWWNKQGVAMTGNAQNPRVVAVLARAMIEEVGSH